MRLRALLLVLIVTLGVSLGVRALAENDAPSGWPGGQQSGVTATGYNNDAQTAAYLNATSTASTTTLTTIALAGVPRFYVNGRPNIPISVRFSAAGQSCAVRYVAINHDVANGDFINGVGPITTITLDGTPPTDPFGQLVAPTYVQDSYGANQAVVLLVSPPGAGTVSLWVGSY